ncbi:reverse transcriptase domain-containing protein [Halalkalibacter alkalisediminis]|uniref:Reverse transcriptase domain-containing protein n=1 Tax=Halalkalibacter alkalisediminis TaxID=935616 RepID=A0ABV6NPF1_9BACI|nr:reverse transcriptase domain-containing protein [Halalkalibacter alkalisediminis]
MHRPQKTSKDDYPLEDKAEPEHTAEACSILHAEPRRRDGECSELISEIIDRDNLNRAYKRVKKNKGKPGIDGMTVDKLPLFLAKESRSLVLSIKDGTYEPQPVKRVEIPKPDGSKRKLGIPTVKDRLVQQAILQVIERWINPHFSEHSFGFRPNLSRSRRNRKSKTVLRRGVPIRGRHRYERFDTVNHDKLMYHVEEFIQDPVVLKLIRKFLRSGIMIGEKYEPSEIGTPQGGLCKVGGVISPVLANLFLHYAFDKWIAINHPSNPFARYADDAVIHCKTEEEAKRVLKSLSERMNECKLELHPSKTKIVYCKDADRTEEKHSV